jgi:hypothetical protein
MLKGKNLKACLGKLFIIFEDIEMIFNMGIPQNLKRLLWLVFCGRLGLESWPKEGLKICPTTFLLYIGGIYICCCLQVGLEPVSCGQLRLGC